MTSITGDETEIVDDANNDPNSVVEIVGGIRRSYQNQFRVFVVLIQVQRGWMRSSSVRSKSQVKMHAKEKRISNQMFLRHQMFLRFIYRREPI